MLKRKLFGMLCILLLCSHDMYVKMDTYFLSPGQQAVIDLYNGTFDKSENVIDRDRMLDASLLGNGQRIKVAESQWSEKDSITQLQFTTGSEGTWVAGVSTKARTIAMKADAFNSYLKHDGIKDMLAQREQSATLDQDAVESYAKHVKAIFQVGDQKSSDWQTPLGYPLEFVPMQNPYDRFAGEQLEVKLLRNGLPLTNQLVYADYAPAKNAHSHDNNTHTHKGDTHSHEQTQTPHSHTKEEDHNHKSEPTEHTHTTGQELRTDDEGIISISLDHEGIWYLRTIHLQNSSKEGLTHQSNWATLTFEVTHKHQDSSHDHAHKHEDGIPTWIFGLLSLLGVAALFVYFRHTQKSKA